MSQFQLFDSVKLKEAISLSEGGFAPEGTPGAIVEVFKDGKAYMVELFGGWVKAEVGEDFVSSDRKASDSFMETIGVETVYSHQLRLVKTAHETVSIRAQLLALIDELPENTLEQVKNFAEFLQQRQHDRTLN